jgi:hypothetical protein
MPTYIVSVQRRPSYPAKLPMQDKVLILHPRTPVVYVHSDILLFVKVGLQRFSQVFPASDPNRMSRSSLCVFISYSSTFFFLFVCQSNYSILHSDGLSSRTMP